MCTSAACSIRSNRICNNYAARPIMSAGARSLALQNGRIGAFPRSLRCCRHIANVANEHKAQEDRRDHLQTDLRLRTAEVGGSAVSRRRGEGSVRFSPVDDDPLNRTTPTTAMISLIWVEAKRSATTPVASRDIFNFAPLSRHSSFPHSQAPSSFIISFLVIIYPLPATFPTSRL